MWLSLSSSSPKSVFLPFLLVYSYIPTHLVSCRRSRLSLHGLSSYTPCLLYPNPDNPSSPLLLRLRFRPIIPNNFSSQSRSQPNLATRSPTPSPNSSPSPRLSSASTRNSLSSKLSPALLPLPNPHPMSYPLNRKKVRSTRRRPGRARRNRKEREGRRRRKRRQRGRVEGSGSTTRRDVWRT
jgi:hypothetical protein